MQDVIDKRQKKPILIIDISVPRNFDPEIKNIENVHLYNIAAKLIHNIVQYAERISSAAEGKTDVEQNSF